MRQLYTPKLINGPGMKCYLFLIIRCLAHDQNLPRRRVINVFITWALRRKRQCYKFVFFYCFFAFSHKTRFHYSVCVKCKRMRRMNPRAHGLKQWLPSWTIPFLMYAKETRCLLRSIYIQSSRQTHTNTCGAFWERFGPRNFTRDQFTSDPLRVNLLSRNIKRNLLYQTRQKNKRSPYEKRRLNSQKTWQFTSINRSVNTWQTACFPFVHQHFPSEQQRIHRS